MVKSLVHFVGAGPGAEDLITLRGSKLLQEADLVIYAGSLVNPALLKECKPSCVLEDSSKLNLDEVILLMKEFTASGKKVVRLHTGDPALYGAIGEQMQMLNELNIEYRVTPGISSVFASAAELACELTAPGITQSLIITRTPGRTPMPNRENVSNFAKTGATLAFFLSIGKITELMEELHDEGVPSDTPAAVVYRAGWPNSRIIRGRVCDIAQKVKDAGITRQAIILVGRALTGPEEKSLLYSSHFSHGYRNLLKKELFHGRCAIYAITEKGVQKGCEIRDALDWADLYIPEKFKELSPEASCYSSKGLQDCINANWGNYDAHIFMGATGIAVRMTAPFLTSKSEDPAVVVCGETGRHIISLTGGHLGGANRLSRKIARITGGEAVITTATDSQNILAFDELAAIERWRVANPKKLVQFNTALLEKSPVDMLIPEEIFQANYSGMEALTHISDCSEIKSNLLVVLNRTADMTIPEGCELLELSTVKYVLGVGCKRDVSFEELSAALDSYLKRFGIARESLKVISSATLKADEQGIAQLAEKLNIPAQFIDAEELSRVPVPTPSDTVLKKIGTPSVAEASSIYVSGGKLVAPKIGFGLCTFAVAEIPAHRENRTGTVTVVGLSSGSARHITPEVTDAIRASDTVAGYTKYVDMIRPFTSGKKVIENGMRGEIERCKDTLNAAATGESVCMVCSGDAGILAMAGLLYEMQAAEPQFSDIKITVLPGITAANIAAASVGAPLQNGYSLISLSNLLVPTEEVEANLRANAQSHLTCALYNPAGKKRRELLHTAVKIFLEKRGSETLCALVKHAGREKEEKWLGKLCDLDLDSVDMSSLLIIGGSRARIHNGIFFENRGYEDKYGK